MTLDRGRRNLLARSTRTARRCIRLAGQRSGAAARIALAPAPEFV